MAVSENYPAHRELLEQKTPVRLLVKPTTLTSLEAVVNGEASAAIVSANTAYSLLNAHQLSDLKIGDDAI